MGYDFNSSHPFLRRPVPLGPKHPTPLELEAEWIDRGDDLLFSEYAEWRRSHYANGLPFPPSGSSGVISLEELNKVRSAFRAAFVGAHPKGFA